MPIQKGPLSFTLFRTDREAPPPPGPEALAERLRSLSFREAVSRSEEKTIGWTGLEDVLDRDFRRYPPVRGNLALFSLRIDRKQVSPALLRFRTLEAQRRLKEESRQERLSRHQQGLLRETIREELLSAAPAVPALFEACWFLPEGRVLFGTHTDGICDDFTLLFRDTFSTVLAPWSPWEEAAADLGPEGPAPFVLGREFLTWLWFKSEERDGAVALDKKEEVELEFIRRIVLEGGEGSHAETVVCHGLNAELAAGCGLLGVHLQGGPVPVPVHEAARRRGGGRGPEGRGGTAPGADPPGAAGRLDRGAPFRPLLCHPADPRLVGGGDPPHGPLAGAGVTVHLPDEETRRRCRFLNGQTFPAPVCGQEPSGMK